MRLVMDINLIRSPETGEIWGVDIEDEALDLDEDDLPKVRWRIFEDRGDEPARQGERFQRLQNHPNAGALAFFSGEAIKDYIMSSYGFAPKDVAAFGDPRFPGAWFRAANAKIAQTRNAA